MARAKARGTVAESVLLRGLRGVGRGPPESCIHKQSRTPPAASGNSQSEFFQEAATRPRFTCWRITPPFSRTEKPGSGRSPWKSQPRGEVHGNEQVRSDRRLARVCHVRVRGSSSEGEGGMDHHRHGRTV